MFGVLLTIGWFLLLLTFLVLIHELGHYLAAKFVKVGVLEFGIGYPPMAKKLFRRWDTDFTINWLPLGGFVRLWGDDAEESLPTAAAAAEHHLTEKSMFNHKKRWERLLIIGAGVFINFLFGVIVFAGLYSKFGIPERLHYVKVEEVLVDSPAQLSGLQVGDQIYKTTVDENKEVSITNAAEFSQLMGENAGEKVTLHFRRSGEETTLDVTLRPKDRPSDQAALGVIPVDWELKFYPWYEQPFRGIYVGLQDSFELGRLILGSLGDMVSKLVMRGQVPSDLSGPIGIVAQAHEMDILSQGWVGTLRYAALLSINLAIMNMLPIPALDGGRAIFVLLEGILGKARRRRWEQRVNGVGMVFLLLLIFLISLKDVVKIIW
jgi:regulator of sigma E protease